MSISTTNHEPTQSDAAPAEDCAADLASAARGIGMRPVRAWIPDEQTKKCTGGAQRTKRSRAKAEENGMKQLSVSLPIAIHPLVKALAQRSKAGESAEAILRELLPSSSPKPNLSTAKPEQRPTLQAMPKWKRWLLMKLLPAEFLSTLSMLS